MSEPVSRRVGIIGGCRTPFARAHGAYRSVGNLELMTGALTGLVERFDLAGQRIDDVGCGAVLKHPGDFNLAREAVQGCGLAPETPGFDIQRACGTSLEAAIALGARIASGQIDCAIAGGCDSISDAPLSYPRDYQRILLSSSRARSMTGRVLPWLGLRPRHFVPIVPAVVEPRTGLSMGESAEIMAQQWEIDRAAQDALALASHQRASTAWDEGFFDELVSPFKGLERDDNLRPDSSLDSLASLKPSFDEAGTLTAGNSSPLTDGGAAVLLASEDWAEERGLEIESWLITGEAAAVDYVGGEGLLMAPAYAVSRMLTRAALTLKDFDFYEIHEAFAGQVLCTLRAWESEDFCREKLGRKAALGAIDMDRLNVKGSSLAVGHPFAATGARILGTASQLVAGQPNSRALISICTAGGMGVTAIVEST